MFAALAPATLAPDRELEDARESLAYWQARAETLPRHAIRRRREARDMAARWQARVAEAAAGELDQAETDVMRLSAHADDVTDAGRGEVADLLRPFYLEYLRKHHVTPK